MSFETDYLIGQRVLVEARAGQNTILYEGNYKGVDSLGGQMPVLVLENAEYHTTANVFWTISDHFSGNIKSSLVRARACAISLDKVISICPDEDNHDRDIPFKK